MPKVNKIQTSFLAGEVSKQMYGHVDNPKYEQGLVYCQNYLPLVQGPLLRRPGTKFVTFVKDSTKLPVLIPFQFSVTQNYMLEFGDKYIRFYQNEGQIVTNSNSFLVTGVYGSIYSTAPLTGQQFPGGTRFTAIRNTPAANPVELLTASSVTIPANTTLELKTPYDYRDLKSIKWTQKQDTLYLTHPSYPPYKLIRTGLNTWDLKQIWFQDGPFLPLNSYASIADNINVTLIPDSVGFNALAIQAGSTTVITNATSAPVTNYIRLTTATPHGFQNGQKVCVAGVQGTEEANTAGVQGRGLFAPGFFTITNSSPQSAYWLATNCTQTNLDLYGSNYQRTYTGSGLLAPALFQLTPLPNSSSYAWADIMVNSSTAGTLANMGGRNIALYDPTTGTRHSGRVISVLNASWATIFLDGPGYLTNSNTISTWSLGVWNNQSGFPSTTVFHQDRLVFSGAPGYPQEVDGSVTGQYEVFSASGSNSIIAANNAVQFTLNSQEMNQVKWLLSSPLGLLAGTQNGEFAITPSTQNAALSPTNVKADQVTAFGSADVQAIFVGNAAIYIQRAQRKVRELLYYWQVGNFRSSNLSEISQHITLPSISKIVSQREPHAFVWVIRDDGNLLSLTYNRDDITLTANAGWARHVLGGRSDSSGSPPDVNSIAVIPSGDTSFDEMWLVTNRYLNGSTLGCVEYMLKPFDDYQAQETSCHLDCAGIYSSSIVVTGLTVAGSCVVTAPNHGLLNSSVVRFYNTVGMNLLSTDINGVVNSSNPFNYQTFVVSSASTNNFFIRDFLGNYINTNSCSIYIGSAVVNQLVTSISNVSWLAGETVSVVADGGIHVNTTVSLAGVLSLAYPAAKVNFGYAYNSDGQMLRSKDGSAQGTSIGATRRVHRVAFMLHNVGDFSYGPSFVKLIPMELFRADANSTDVAPALFDGIERVGFEGEYTYDDHVCWRQSSGLPGMVQSITRFLEEQDV